MTRTRPGGYVRRCLITAAVLAGAGPAAAQTRNIMLTGFWPPTNEMLRRFSTNPDQNPSGWIGENWEGRGFNVYSFFPEVGGTGQAGTGDFMVDYQDVSEDFWRITDEIRPLAIISFSWTGGRAEYGNKDWELEWRNRNRTSWSNDYIAPFQPTPNPPDSSVPGNYIRYSSLPTQEIIDAVNEAFAGTNGPQAYLDDFSTTFGGSFVSEFMGYHVNWYHDLHSDPTDRSWNMAAGHIHVGRNVTVPEGVMATEVTLRALTDWLYLRVPSPGTGAGVLLAAGVVAARRRRAV